MSDVNGPTYDRDGRQFDEFFRQELVPLVAWLMSIGVEREDARDAATEAMVLACSAWENIDYPRAWVRTVARRKAQDAWRRHQNDLRRAAKDAWWRSRSDDQSTVTVEEAPRILALLSLLPDQQRLVIAWYFDGWSTGEIAELTGMSAGTVRSHLRHARKGLKAALAREEEQKGDERA